MVNSRANGTRFWPNIGTLMLKVGFVAMVAGGCGGDMESMTNDDSSADSEGQARYQTVVETQTLTVGDGITRVVRFGPAEAVELEIPWNVVRRPARIDVSLVTGTVRRGIPPANDAGLLVRPESLNFDVPVRVRQRIVAPPPGKTYASVVLPDDGDAFELRGPARRVARVDASELEVWEGEGDGSGLWGLGLIDATEDSTDME